VLLNKEADRILCAFNP